MTRVADCGIQASMWYHRTGIRLTLLVVVALALRLGFCAARDRLGRTVPRDYHREYILSGARLLEWGTLTSPLFIEDSDRRPSALMPPVYVALVAGVYGLFGTETFAATLVLQVINAAATSLLIPLVFSVTRRLAGERAGWVCALVVALNPVVIGYAAYIWDTSLFALGVTLGVWLTVRLSARPVGVGGCFLLGLYLGLLALLNPALTIAYPLIVLWLLTRSHGWRFGPILRGIGATVLGWLIAITPWTVRNYVHFGDLMYIRSGLMLELWLGVCPEADAHGSAVYTRRFPLLNSGLQEHVVDVGEQAYLEECGQRAMETLAAGPWRLVRLTATRAVDYWAGTTFSHAAPGEGGWPRSLPRAAIMLFVSGELVVILLCLFVARRAAHKRRVDTDLRWLFAIIVSVSVVYCLTHVQIRFRAPTEPLLAIVLSACAASAFDTFSRRRCTAAPSQ